MTSENPEISKSVQTGSFCTNYHDQGEGDVVLLIHGSGPGVSAWANWRLCLPALAENFRVIAPDMAGFGYTERQDDFDYDLASWVTHTVDLLDALEIERVNIVGNSFGGALAIAIAIQYPEKVNRLVLMGSIGVEFEITPGLNAVWSYEPSIDNMRKLLDLFAFNRELVSDDLAQLRYEASIRPGFHESFSSMFTAPRQRRISELASPDSDIRRIPHETLVIHGREDKVIPMSTSLQLFDLIPQAQLHMFGNCGHWTQIEHSKRFNDLVAAFFQEGRANAS